MNRTIIRRAALPAALALSLGLAACSGSNETSTGSGSSDSASSSAASLSGSLNGAGASTQTVAQQTWAAGFQGTNPDVQLNYDPVGSGGGREQFLSGGVPFAGSDAYLKDEELTQAQETCQGGNAIDIPVYVSPIAVAFNLEGVKTLNLSPDTVAGIFLGNIKTWNDPAIAADNPGVTLPATAVTPVHRSDDSGTTQNFTDYLHTAAPTVWTAEAAQKWPVEGGEAAQGTSGVVQAIKGGNGTIGYADESQVAPEGLGIVSVKVGDAFVGPTAEAAAAVVDASPEVEGRPDGDIAIKIDRATTAAGAYPVVLVSYDIVCSKYEDAATAELVKAYMTYVTSEEGQEAAAKAAGSAPISEKLRTQITASLEKISS
ncbi:phosphate ABC transporter substrate-binding protein PstS [Kineococcus aurantiacus]|uniref:Phosphate-binding protein n=1 Tax=Kineococcus aurantiacus TaxID=37633 RepID=A0A7Y9DJS1_9ACTN|nr:phosphate ABC transporter substrate-binding protein PstS [Kineococcus aurantiacus]NYD21702.1 phosphate transport system substrate-binding protein [Kineococcus aurantiacus]